MDWSPDGIEEIADNLPSRWEDAAEVLRFYAQQRREAEKNRGDNVYRPNRP